MREILLATKNRDKVREITKIFGDLPLKIRAAADFPDLPDVVEDGETLQENAAKKARVLAEKTGMLAVADDTGLFVPALDGEPGVYSARYAGEKATYEDNCLKLLRRMERLEGDARAAYFSCVGVVAGEGVFLSAEGRVDGTILREPRGEEGFGYDPIFLHPPSGRTFAELSLDEKNRISHRALAMRGIRQALEEWIGAERR